MSEKEQLWNEIWDKRQSSLYPVCESTREFWWKVYAEWIQAVKQDEPS